MLNNFYKLATPIIGVKNEKRFKKWSEKMKNKFKIVTISLGIMLLFTIGSVAVAEEVDETLTDPKGDVMDYFKTMTVGVPVLGDFNQDIDIKELRYEKREDDTKLQFTLEVYGDILDSGDLDLFGENIDYEDEENMLSILSSFLEPTVSYAVLFETTEKIYTINYINKNCSLSITNHSSIFEVEETQWDLLYIKDGGKLIVEFDLKNSDEKIKNVSIQTMHMKIDISDTQTLLKMLDQDSDYYDDEELFSVMKWYMDEYPNQEGYYTSFTTTPLNPQPNEPVELTAYVYGGTEPYTYQWDFGDGNRTDWSYDSSIDHIFTKAGTYNVNLSVSDSNNDLTYVEIPVSIGTTNNDNLKEEQNSDKSKDNEKKSDGGIIGAITGNGNTGLIAFIALVAIILVAGVAVLVFLSKR